MKKLTLKEKAMEAFNLSNLLISYSHRLAQDARDFGWVEAKKLAKEMEEIGKEYRAKLV